MKVALDIWYELWEEAGSRGSRNGQEQEETVTQTETNQTVVRAPRWRTPGLPAYWLIATSENDPIEVLTLVRDGVEMLPVFSHEEEAEMFLRLLRGVGEDWRVRESRTGELVSVLYGPSCADVKEVALDPLPEMVAEKTVGLVSLLRERFIQVITARRRRARGPCTLGMVSAPRAGEWNRRSEADRIADRYP